MYHYIALVWPLQDETAAQDALRVNRTLLQTRESSWKILVSTNGFAVYSQPSVDATFRAYMLPDRLGVILGHLFAAGPEAFLLRDSDLPCTTIIQTKGLWLLEKAWGDYIAILRVQDEIEVRVLRDCSGRIPCFYLKLGALYVFFADVADLARLNIPLSLNERYLASFISRQPLHVRETGLKEITELLAGDSVTVSVTGASHESFWDPRRVVAERMINSYNEAEAALVGTAQVVIRSWAMLYKRILLSLSGGLDSAIVLGTLKRAGFAERVVCLTQYTAGTSDDERIYARATARMAGVTLVEIPRISDGRVFADNLRLLPPDPRPDVSKTARMLALPALTEIAQSFGCDSLWTGQGGDQIFLQARHAYEAADYLIQNGASRGLASQIYHSALLSRQSVWNVAHRALIYRLRKTLAPPVVLGGHGSRFLAPSTPPGYSEEYLMVPWRVGFDERIPPGKLLQLDTYLDLLNRHRPIFGREQPYERHPLISQPLLELSLQIPTYHLLNGGRQRGLAREAFADRVPRCVLMREDKGEITDQVRSLLRGCAPVIAESLLDGTLVSLGILDRTALEAILCRGETFSQDDVFPLFSCIAAEAWAQHWRTRPPRFADTSPPLNASSSIA